MSWLGPGRRLQRRVQSRFVVVQVKDSDSAGHAGQYNLTFNATFGDEIYFIGKKYNI